MERYGEKNEGFKNEDQKIKIFMNQCKVEIVLKKIRDLQVLTTVKAVSCRLGSKHNQKIQILSHTEECTGKRTNKWEREREREGGVKTGEKKKMTKKLIKNKDLKTKKQK